MPELLSIHKTPKKTRRHVASIVRKHGGSLAVCIAATEGIFVSLHSALTWAKEYGVTLKAGARPKK